MCEPNLIENPVSKDEIVLPMELKNRFRGQEPNPNALLKQTCLI